MSLIIRRQRLRDYTVEPSTSRNRLCGVILFAVVYNLKHSLIPAASRRGGDVEARSSVC